MNRVKVVLKISLVISWVLFVVMVLEALSGYAIVNPSVVKAATFGFLRRQNSYSLHTALDYPLVTLMLLHVLLTTYLRHHRKRPFLFYIILVLCATLFIVFTIAEFRIHAFRPSR